METTPAYYTDLIARYFFGEATPADIRKLETWVNNDPANASLFAECGRTWKAVEDEKIAATTDVDLAWASIAGRLQKQPVNSDIDNLRLAGARPETENRPDAFLYHALRIAAVVLLIAIPAFFLSHYLQKTVGKQLSATTGTIEQLLPDGTRVTLNEGATLSYPSRFEGSFRKVTLQGEAWFEVAHNKSKPFIIAAGDARVRVVGTSFFINTKAMNQSKEVILSQGVVRVYFENDPGRIAFVFPGQKAELLNDGSTIHTSVNEDVNYLAWKTKHLVFSDSPLNEVAATLARVYHTGISIRGTELSRCRMTATFDKQSLEAVLNVLKATLDLQVTNTGAGIELSGHGCNQGK